MAVWSHNPYATQTSEWIIFTSSDMGTAGACPSPAAPASTANRKTPWRLWGCLRLSPPSAIAVKSEIKVVKCAINNRQHERRSKYKLDIKMSSKNDVKPNISHFEYEHVFWIIAHIYDTSIHHLILLTYYVIQDATVQTPCLITYLLGYPLRLNKSMYRQCIIYNVLLSAPPYS